MYLFENKTVIKTIASPLNYLGGKYRLLSQILPIFPDGIARLVDLFCGGCNVGINVEATRVVFNDKNTTLVELLKMFQQISTIAIFDRIEWLIQRYGLSNSSKYGYEYYGANGSDGLVDYNRKAYLKMREDFNNLREQNQDYYIRLYVLCNLQ